LQVVGDPCAARKQGIAEKTSPATMTST